MYSKLTMGSGSNGWLPSSSSTTLIPSLKHKQEVQKPTESAITLPTDKQLLDKQVLEDLKAAIPARLDLTNDDQPGLSLGYDFSDCLSGSNLLPTILHYLHYYSEHCAVILEALQYPQANTIVGCFLIVVEQCLISFNLKDIVGITPAEYMMVLAFTSEKRDFEVQAKCGLPSIDCYLCYGNSPRRHTSLLKPFIQFPHSNMRNLSLHASRRIWNLVWSTSTLMCGLISAKFYTAYSDMALMATSILTARIQTHRPDVWCRAHAEGQW